MIFYRHTEIPLPAASPHPGSGSCCTPRTAVRSYPGCTAPGYQCQAHHAAADWADGGQTNIDEETLACGPHNRLVTKDDWKTRKRKGGRTEWIPPPHLDWGHLPLAGDGQTRVNDLHHPENLLRPDDD